MQKQQQKQECSVCNDKTYKVVFQNQRIKLYFVVICVTFIHTKLKNRNTVYHIAENDPDEYSKVQSHSDSLRVVG